VTKPAWLARAERGWPASFPIAQFPNAPLLVALGASLAGRFLDDRAHDYATAVFYVALGIWAYGEITDGANWVRRLLGLAGLAYVVVELAAALD
jgi:hypothetical protein